MRVGEESDIIVASLVRCNEQKRIGFLKIPNRVNVLLTRAKHGMFLLGSKRTLLAATSPQNPWPKILKVLDSRGQVGRALPLVCSIHNTETLVTTAADFERVAGGGCNRPCGAVKECGHACNVRCHLLDREHRLPAHRCKERCKKSATRCTAEHLCTAKCFEDCPPCPLPTEITLECGHSLTVECHRARSTPACDHSVELLRTCGHKSSVKCSQKEVEARKPCTAVCAAPLPCGHVCPSPCSHRPRPCQCTETVCLLAASRLHRVGLPTLVSTALPIAPAGREARAIDAARPVIENCVFECELGRGGQAVVWKGRYRDIPVAVKINTGGAHTSSDWRNEVAVLKCAIRSQSPHSPITG